MKWSCNKANATQNRQVPPAKVWAGLAGLTGPTVHRNHAKMPHEEATCLSSSQTWVK